MKKIVLAAALALATGGAFAQSTGAHGPNYEDRPALWQTSPKPTPAFQSSAGITVKNQSAQGRRETVPVIRNGAGNDRDHAVYISGPILTQH
jgi:hypothetical protein